MTVENVKPDATPSQGQTPDTPGVPDVQLEMVDNTQITQLRQESARYRHQAKEANEKLVVFEQAEQARLDAEKTEIELANDSVTALQKQADAIQADNKLQSDLIQGIFERELESIPEDKREHIQGETPSEKLSDLSRLRALGLFAVPKETPKPTAPNLNAPDGSHQMGSYSGITEERKKAFLAAGWSQEEIDKYVKE